jgi:hypothetical protein
MIVMIAELRTCLMFFQQNHIIPKHLAPRKRNWGVSRRTRPLDGTPIAGYFMENRKKHGWWFGGMPCDYLWRRKHLFSLAISFHGNPLADLVALQDFDLWLTPNYLGQAYLWKFTWPWRKETAWNPHESFRQITHWQQMSNRSLKTRKERPRLLQAVFPTFWDCLGCDAKYISHIYII